MRGSPVGTVQKGAVSIVKTRTNGACILASTGRFLNNVISCLSYVSLANCLNLALISSDAGPPLRVNWLDI